MNKCTYILNDSIWKHAIAVEITLHIFVSFQTRLPERSVISLRSIQQFNFLRLFSPIVLHVHYLSFVNLYDLFAL